MLESLNEFLLRNLKKRTVYAHVKVEEIVSSKHKVQKMYGHSYQGRICYRNHLLGNDNLYT